jgi:sterol 14-demethylase
MKSLTLFCSRDGHGLSDEEIVGMMIGLLMAGQHTSSTTSAWLGFYLAKNKTMQVCSN